MQCNIHIIPINSPSDVSGVKAAFDNKEILPEDIIAVIGKTEGNGCVNDFTRGYMTDSLRQLMKEYVCKSKIDSISFIMSGGTEGVLSPHLNIITKKSESILNNSKSRTKSLAVGVAKTKIIKPHELGRQVHIEMVRQATLQAMKEAKIDNVNDVHFVQIKCPLLTTADFEDMMLQTITNETYKSMAYSRGASSLGVGLALKENGFDSVEELAQINCCELGVYSSVASASAGAELNYCEVIVLGNSNYATGDLFICHDVMRDALDKESITRAKDSLDKGKESSFEILQVLAKAEADPTGKIRGFRTTMLNDSDINHTRHARAAVGAVLAAEVGSPLIYVSGGAEHQGPEGGGPVALICKRVDKNYLKDKIKLGNINDN